MRTINVKEILGKIQEEQATEKPLPTIIRKPRKQPEPKPEPDDQESRLVAKTVIPKALQESRTDLVNQCWREFNAVLLERKKLSSQIWKMVGDGATQAELKSHYDKIESFSPELNELFDRARFVEQYGKLPDPVAPSVDILLLKDQKKKLIDLRCKLQKKIKVGHAKNPARVIEWQLELDKANAEYNFLDEKIKKLEGKA